MITNNRSSFGIKKNSIQDSLTKKANLSIIQKI